MISLSLSRSYQQITTVDQDKQLNACWFGGKCMTTSSLANELVHSEVLQ